MKQTKPIIHGHDHGHGSSDPVLITYESVGTGGGGGGTGPLVEVRRNSADPTYTRPRINLIEGVNVSMSIADDVTDDEVDVTIAMGAVTAVPDPLWTGLGFKAISGDPKIYGGNVGINSGTVYAVAVWFKEGTVVSSVGLFLVTGATAVTTFEAGIYSSALALLAGSGNAAAGPVNGWRFASLSSVWTCPADGIYYLAFLFVGSTPGSFFSNSFGDTGFALIAQSPGPGNPWIVWRQTGQTDLPATAAPGALTRAPMMYAL